MYLQGVWETEDPALAGVGALTGNMSIKFFLYFTKCFFLYFIGSRVAKKELVKTTQCPRPVRDKDKRVKMRYTRTILIEYQKRSVWDSSQCSWLPTKNRVQTRKLPVQFEIPSHLFDYDCVDRSEKRISSRIWKSTRSSEAPDSMDEEDVESSQTSTSSCDDWTDEIRERRMKETWSCRCLRPNWLRNWTLDEEMS